MKRIIEIRIAMSSFQMMKVQRPVSLSDKILITPGIAWKIKNEKVYSESMKTFNIDE